MFAEMIWAPYQASTSAYAIDRLFLFLFAICGSVGLLVAVLLIGFSVRYRRRPNTPPPPRMSGNTRLEVFWTVTPLFIFIVTFAWGAVVYYDIFRAPDHSTAIYGVGKQWMWKFQHPGGQREINSLHVPVGRPFKLMLTSEDVIHGFFVPDFRVHMDVLPERYNSVWFQPTRPGTYHLFCAQYCGTNHAGMVGDVVVMEQADYENWLQLNAEGSLALEGRKTFLKYRCISCHSADGTARAPVLEDLYGRRVPLREGRTVLADEQYIRESIYYPARKIVAGYENIMPTFKGQVSEQEIVELIAYIQSLKKGQTPPRVEQSRPPADTPPINSRK